MVLACTVPVVVIPATANVRYTPLSESAFGKPKTLTDAGGRRVETSAPVMAASLVAARPDPARLRPARDFSGGAGTRLAGARASSPVGSWIAGEHHIHLVNQPLLMPQHMSGGDQAPGAGQHRRPHPPPADEHRCGRVRHRGLAPSHRPSSGSSSGWCRVADVAVAAFPAHFRVTLIMLSPCAPAGKPHELESEKDPQR